MDQKGFKVGSPGGYIDQLTYTYPANSNQLSQVGDAANDPNSTLGDFHFNGSKQAYDYTYDINGNLTQDNNKAIDNISYNYLNLPQNVHMSGKGNILYTYDAAGDKLQKQTIDSVSGLATTTLYMLGGFQYQERSPIATPGSGVDTLQFAGQEEGRARWAYHKYLNGNSAYAWEYDFFEKDHLGNTRVVLTQQRDSAQYMATMEAAYRAKEMALFYNIDSTSYAVSAIPGGYPTDNTTTPNDSVARVNGNGHKMGPAILLKVMSGDSVAIGVKSFYHSNGTGGSPSSAMQSILNSLASGLGGITGANSETMATLLTTNTVNPVYSALNSFLSTNDATTTGKPQAYLNWMLLDNQFNYVADHSGAIPVGGADVINPLAKALGIHHSGFLYIWVSNETPDWDVFFDNLSVATFSGPMLEENHYYPYGLTMAGISDKAIKSNYAENKYRFQKQEFQNKEFSDGSGLEMYEFKYRMDDPQTGRFWSVDPLANKYVYNSPYAFSEDKVTNNIELEGLEAASVPTPLPAFWRAVQGEFNALGNQIDNMVSHTTSDDHITSKQNPAPNVEVKRSIETSSTQTLNFGAGDFMEHLTRTNTSEGGPSLKMEVKTTTDVKDKTTTTINAMGITTTGVETVSRTDGTRTSSTTISGPAKLGDVPNGTLSVGFTTDSHGLSTFTFGASGSQKLLNTTYGGGASFSESGKSGQKGSASASFSVYGEKVTDSNTHRSEYTIKIF